MFLHLFFFLLFFWRDTCKLNIPFEVMSFVSFFHNVFLWRYTNNIPLGFIFPTDQSMMSLLFKTAVHAKRGLVNVMEFNTTFNNISVSWWRKSNYSEKTTDFSNWSIYLTALHIIGRLKGHHTWPQMGCC